MNGTPVSAARTSCIDQPPVHAPAIQPERTTPRCDSSTSTGRTSRSSSLGPAPPSPSRPGPLVLGGRPWDPGPVIDANPEARALGVRRGMPLGSAHRLAPEATFVEPDPDADRAAAEAVFEALAAFSPGLAGSTDPTDPAFGLFEVQADGLGPLWGPEPVLVGRLVGGARGASLPEPEDGGADHGSGSPGPGSRRPSPPSTPAPAPRSSSRPVARRRSSPRARPAC